jgi:hypothetical protein
MITPREGMVPPESVFRHHRSTVALRALLLLHLEHRVQRAFAEIARGGANSPFGGVDRDRMLRQRGGAPPPGRAFEVSPASSVASISSAARLPLTDQTPRRRSVFFGFGGAGV